MTKLEKRIRTAAAALVVLLAGWAVLKAQTQGGFKFLGIVSRVITPNGDGINDYVLVCLDNPSDSGVSGKIYSLLGSSVGTMTGPLPLSAPPPGGVGNVACPTTPSGFAGKYLFWDGTSGGTRVRSGVYVYEIKSEGQSITGTLVVVR
jgi:hypothetical protein